MFLERKNHFYNIFNEIHIGWIMLGVITFLCFIAWFVTECYLHPNDWICNNFLYIAICIFIIVTLLLFIEVGHLSDTGGIILGFLMLCAYVSLCIVFFGDEFIYYEINYWACLVLWIFVFFCNLFFKDENVFLDTSIDKENKVIYAFSAVWSIVAMYVTLGTKIFNYGNHSIARLYEVHCLLDFRWNLLIVIALGILCKSFFIARNTDVGKIEDYFIEENPILGKSDTVYGQIVISFERVKIEILNMLKSIGNTVYVAGKYFYRKIAIIFKEFCKTLLLILLKSRDTFLYISILGLTILLFYLSHNIPPFLLTYLRTDSYFPFPFSVLIVLLYIISVFLILALINYLLKFNFMPQRNNPAYYERRGLLISAGMYMVISSLIAGALLCIVSQFKASHFIHFKLPGIYSIGFLTIIIMILISSKFLKVKS